MKRAVIKDRRGDIVGDVRLFQNDADFDAYTKSKAEILSRYGQRFEELPASTLTPDQMATLEMLRKLAVQAHGILEPFVMDGDMRRRWQNRKPTEKDIQALAECLRQAAAEFEVLAPLDFQVQK